MTVAGYPLQWPDHIGRWTGARQPGAFKTTLPAAMEKVSTSLRLFGRDSGKPVSDVVLSSNVTLGVTKPADPGIAVWFVWEGREMCIPIDRYSTVEANLTAIHHVLEARRTELRHGTLALVRATFKGFHAALPAPGQHQKRTWRQVMGFEPSALVPMAVLEERYRKLAKERHPDMAGGSQALMAELNAARAEALGED